MWSSLGKRQLAVFALAAVVGLAVVGWVAARQIRSPAQIAADTAPPTPSPITVPVVRRTLSSEVIVRGTVRYGAPQSVVLASSQIKQGSDIVTRAARKGARLRAGDVAMAVDGRPVFVLPGAVPMHRDLGPGDRGADVLQLERALATLGFRPGPVDGRYDSATEAAVSAFYLRKGWDPFGPTQMQLEQLRSAEAAAAQARDAYLQAQSTVQQGRPTEVAQARVDAATARDALDTAVLGVKTAQAKLKSARDQAKAATAAKRLAQANAWREQEAADLEVSAKRAALNAAMDEERVARAKYDELPIDAPPSEREAAAANVRQAQDNVARAKAELRVAVAAASAARASRREALARTRAEAAQAAREARLSAAELSRARQAVATARKQAADAAQRVRLLGADAGTLQAMRGSAAREAARTQAEVARLSRAAGVQVPANEILFFPTLELRVDAVKSRRGSTISGAVMNVSNSRLAVDSSLSVSDRKLVRVGDPVVIEEEDLNIKGSGRVGRVADTPGTNRVDPTRFYFSVVPELGLRSLVGASVKLTIAVRSTKGSVLAVPASALSVGGDGTSRVQVRRGGRTELINVVPGLAAKGLVEVRPTGGARLSPGDLVVVGSSRPAPVSAAGGSA